MKIVDYPRVTEVDSENVILMDGANGTTSIIAGDFFSAVAAKANSFSIQVSDWIASTRYSAYDFEATVIIPGLKAGDLIRADFDLDSITAASTAEIASAGTSSDDSATFYAKKIPDVVLTGMYVIFKAGT